MDPFDTKAQELLTPDPQDEVSGQPSTAVEDDCSDIILVPAGDNTPRWSPGDRLHQLFERRCDEFERQGENAHLAIDSDEASLTYDELDRRANRLGRYLIHQGLGAGDIIGLLFDRSVHSYISLLAVQKIHASYVPLDVGFPEDRIAYIAEDASVSMILSLSEHAEKLEGLTTPLLCLDRVEQDIVLESDARLSVDETGHPLSELSYIIYTSGTTGRPKGVPITHGSICNFVRVAAEVYGYRADDRVYQGLTIAFDFSVEEIWVPLVVGATLVPNQTGRSLVGSDLHAFLAENNVTAMCCVPTLLATIEDDLPELRLLITSGEACPHDLVKRWWSRERTILNAYGPTEATVTATITELYPDKPVTIGGPLPTYSIVVLSPDENQALPKGEVGEIGIAGICLATGYLGREDLTKKVFIDDFLDIPDNPSNRIYRTGDLGRVNAEGEIEYLGRIDTQVKIRGYRIELTEIESVIMQLPGIAQAVVDTYEPEPGAKELVAYYTAVEGGEHLAPERVSEALSALMPSYMVPAFYEALDIIPMTTNDKADRKALPAPSGQRLSRSDRDYVAPETPLEGHVADVLAGLLQIERVSVEDHFFDDLGTNSLLMARFSSRIRKECGITDFSMRDIYLNPTVRELAALLGEKGETEGPAGNQDSYRVASKRDYYLCGALQLLFYGAHIALGVWLLIFTTNWVFSAGDMWDAYVRVIGFGMASLVVSLALPFAVKWTLIGRWKEQRIPVWSLSYFRFWVVRQYIQVNPMAMFGGTPIYNMYLRMLGAKIGRNVVILSKSGPVCTDLISVGDNTILSRGSILKGYRAEAGYIQTGPVSIGSDAFVGEGSVIEINSVMEDGTQLAHASSLQPQQVIPAGKRYHGSPAEETDTDFATLETKTCTGLRKFIYSAYLVIGGYFILLPLPLFALIHFLPFLLGEGDAFARFSTLVSDYWREITMYLPIVSAVLFALAIPTGLAFVWLLPRIANLFIKEDKTYVLYGLRYLVFHYIRAASNVKFFNDLFGDSSYITRYLQFIGYDLSKVVQTGSNFGVNHQHDNPLLCHVGSGTMVSDGLIMKNAHFSTSSFKVSRAVIGDENYLGNSIIYPSDGRTGDNCLLATKVMIPIDGPMRENVGLLGSPSFEIPRSTLRDQQASDIDDDDRARGLRNKNAHNLKTMAIWLAAQWLIAYLAAYLGFASLLLYNDFGVASLVGGSFVGFALGIGYFLGLEWWSLGFKRLRPVMCTVYDERFWAVERHWKMAINPLHTMFAGTPFKNVFSRMLGVKIGKRVFDDGCGLTEKTLVEIGDHCTLNEAGTLQSHSLEEGVFKADHIKLGNGCTVGLNGFVHYGVTTGDNVILAADSFVMKGETVETDSIWQGNPAKAI